MPSIAHNAQEYQRSNSVDGIPTGWGVEVQIACTRWLKARGLLAQQQDPRLAASFQRGGNAARRRGKLPVVQASLPASDL